MVCTKKFFNSLIFAQKLEKKWRNNCMHKSGIEYENIFSMKVYDNYLYRVPPNQWYKRKGGDSV